MFDQNSNPQISNYVLSVSPIMGIIETRDGNIVTLSHDATATVVSLNGKVLDSFELFHDVKIVSFNEYEDQIWLTTSNKMIYVLSNDLSILNQYQLNEMAESVAPLQDRSGVVVTYFDYLKEESHFELRSLPDFNILAKGFYGPKQPVISSVAFHHDNTLYLACCSKNELCLLKEEKGGLVLISEHSEEGGDGALNFSQLLYHSKRFLIDNLTGTIKTHLDPEKYMSRICFFRNDSAVSGAVAKRENWVAFLNPESLKLVNYDTKKSYKFETKFNSPTYVKILKYHVVAACGSELTIYNFMSNSLDFIMN